MYIHLANKYTAHALSLSVSHDYKVMTSLRRWELISLCTHITCTKSTYRERMREGRSGKDHTNIFKHYPATTTTTRKTITASQKLKFDPVQHATLLFFSYYALSTTCTTTVHADTLLRPVYTLGLDRHNSGDVH